MNRFDLLPSVITSMASGSRVIAPSTVTAETDEDFVLLVTSKHTAVRELSTLGYREITDGSYENNSIRTMRSVREGYPGYEESQKLHNLILVEGLQAYKRWAIATHLAKEFGLTDKRHRIMLFSAIKSGGLAVDDEAKIARKLETVVQDEVIGQSVVGTGCTTPASPTPGLSNLLRDNRPTAYYGATPTVSAL